MTRCASNNDVLRTFILLELYIVAIMTSIVGAIYIVSAIPIKFDVLRMAILASIILMVSYAWYKLTIEVMRRKLSL